MPSSFSIMVLDVNFTNPYKTVGKEDAKKTDNNDQLGKFNH